MVFVEFTSRPPKSLELLVELPDEGFEDSVSPKGREAMKFNTQIGVEEVSLGTAEGTKTGEKR